MVCVVTAAKLNACDERLLCVRQAMGIDEARFNMCMAGVLEKYMKMH